jgi:Tol biopolymer transport system component
MRRVGIVAIAVTALALVTGVSPSAAEVPGVNGKVVFGRFDPAVGDTLMFTVNPDGSDLQQIEPFPVECPHWSPDGTRIATCGGPTGGATLIVNLVTGIDREIPMADPTLFTACFVWTPDARRLACESFNDDGSRNGIYTIRVSDGRGLRQLTSVPGGDDIPCDYSPDGSGLLLSRNDPARKDGQQQAMFVVGADGSGLKRITPWGGGSPNPPAPRGGRCGGWSPDGRWIVYTGGTGGGSLYLVHPDGTGLRQVRIQTGTSRYRAFDVTWSPDGSRIALTLDVGNGSNDIYTLRPDGTDLVHVTTALPDTPGEGDQFADWGVPTPTG